MWANMMKGLIPSTSTHTPIWTFTNKSVDPPFLRHKHTAAPSPASIGRDARPLLHTDVCGVH